MMNNSSETKVRGRKSLQGDVYASSGHKLVPPRTTKAKNRIKTAFCGQVFSGQLEVRRMVSLNPLSAHLLDEEDMDLRFCYREHYKYSEFVILKGLKEEPKFVTIPRSGGLKEVEWHRIVSGLKLLEDGRNLLVQNYVRSSSLILRIERLLRLV
jgi:hypothetical protein